MGWYKRVRNLTRRDQIDRDIERELAFHLAERVDEYIGAGMCRSEAVRKARRQMGNYTIHKEGMRDMGLCPMEELLATDSTDYAD